MTATYRGYEISVKREKCLSGWQMLYFSVMRLSDGWFCMDSFEDSAETVRGKMKQMKRRIDNEHTTDDPWCEQEKGK